MTRDSRDCRIICYKVIVIIIIQFIVNYTNGRTQLMVDIYSWVIFSLFCSLIYLKTLIVPRFFFFIETELVFLIFTSTIASAKKVNYQGRNTDGNSLLPRPCFMVESRYLWLYLIVSDVIKILLNDNSRPLKFVSKLL